MSNDTDKTGLISKIPISQRYSVNRMLARHGKEMNCVAYTEYELSAVVHYLLYRIEGLEKQILANQIDNWCRLKQSEDI